MEARKIIEGLRDIEILAKAVVKLTEENEKLVNGQLFVFPTQTAEYLRIIHKQSEALREAARLLFLSVSHVSDGRAMEIASWHTKYSALIGGETK